MATIDDIAARLLFLEAELVKVIEALNRVPSKRQLKELSVLRQTEIEELKRRVNDLESQVAILEAEG